MNCEEEINDTINNLYDLFGDIISKEDIFTTIVSHSVKNLVNKQLFEEDPLSDDDELSISLATDIINAIEKIIDDSSLPTKKILAYGAKAIYGLANMRDI